MNVIIIMMSSLQSTTLGAVGLHSSEGAPSKELAIVIPVETAHQNFPFNAGTLGSLDHWSMMSKCQDHGSCPPLRLQAPVPKLTEELTSVGPPSLLMPRGTL